MDRYQMLSVLGEGTYGIVYRCLDTETDAIVAIKRFYNLDASEYTRQAMQRELAALKLLRGCSYIVQMDRVVRVSDTHVCMVMEFVPHTLLDVLEKAKPHGLPLQPLRVFLYTLLRAVESCHQHGIIHRDIKPENILMRADGPVSLCDFGFARLSHTGATRNEYTISQEANNSGDRMSNHDAGSREDEFDAVGRADCANSSTSVMTSYVATRWYRSPEMLLKIPYYGGEVDVWAVGCVFAEAADGEPLLPGESEMEQLALITTRVGPLPPSCLDLLQQSRQMTMPPTTDQATANGVDTSAPGQCANPGDCAPPDEPGEAAGKYDTTYVHKGHHDMRTSSSRALVSETSVTRVSPYIQDRYGMCLGQDGVNLLSGLLHPDARQRLSADRALLHPFFADLHAAHTLQLDTKHSKDGKQTASRAITQTKDAKGGNGTVTRPVLVHFSPSTYDTTRDKHNCKRVQHSKKHSFDRSRTECARRICAQLPTVIHDSRRARREDCMRSARGHRGFATIFSASSSSYYTSPKAHTPRRQLVNHTRRTEAEPFATTSTTTGKEMWQTQSPAAVAATAAVAAMQARRDDDLARGRAKQSIEKSSLLRDVRCRSSSPRCTLPTATGALTSSVATRQRHLPSSSPRRAAPRDTVTLPNTATAPALKKLPAAVAIARRARAVRQTAGQQMHGLLESMTSFRGSSTSNVSARTTVCSIGTPARFASTPATNNSASVSSCIGPVSSGPSSSRATTLFRFISLTRSRAVGAPRQQKSEHSPTFSGKSNLLPHRIARVGADNSSCSGADSSSKTMTVHAMRPRNNTNVYATGDTTASVTHSRSTALWRSGTTHATSRPTQPSPSWRLPSITNRHSSALHFSATIEPSTTASVYVAGDAVSAKSPDQTMDSAMTHSADVDSTNSLIRKAERTN